MIAEQNKISAIILSDLLKKAQQNYSQFALKKFLELSPEVHFGHGHKTDKKMLPNPATFAIDLAEAVSSENNEMEIWMYSDHPFPWRVNSAVAKNKVEREALTFLQKNPDEIYSYSDQHRYFFGSAITMSGQSCVDCHNTHPQSPKRDWQLGEVRAVLAVNIEQHEQAKSVNLQVISYIIYFLLALCTFCILYLLNRLHQLDRTMAEANTDKLTALYNRNYVNNFLIPKFISMTHGKHYHGLGLLLIDFDHFKQINDEFGHDAGDQCLVEISAILTSELKSSQAAIRWGGEEFMVFIPDVSKQELANVSERIRVSVENYSFTEHKLKKTVSLGACYIEAIAEPDFYAVVKTADNALYEAKKIGRNTVVVDEYKVD